MKRYQISLLSLLLCLLPDCAAFPQAPAPTLVVPLPGSPKDLFAGNLGFTCIHGFRGATRIFWLSPTRIVTIYSTVKPCSKEAEANFNVRLIVFDLSGKTIATHDWRVTPGFDLLRGPNGTLVLRFGPTLHVLDDQLHEVDTGEFDVAPEAVLSSPQGRTLPVLTQKGDAVEFYAIHPLHLLSTVSRSNVPNGTDFTIAVAGDERVAALACAANTDFCNRVRVFTPEENFSLPNGVSWSYDDPDKKVLLTPIGFLTDGALLIHRDSASFFSAPQVLLSKTNGTARPLPQAKGLGRPTHLIGIANQGDRFALQSGGEPIASPKRFLVLEIDRDKPIFSKSGSAIGSKAAMSPDGKWIAIMDRSQLALYPLP